VIFKYLHILTMFTAVTLMFGGEVLFHLLRRTDDVRSLRRFVAVVDPVFRIGVGLLTLGVVFGLLAAVTIGWNLAAGWLVLAYVLIALIYLVGFGIGVPYFGRVRAAFRDLPDDEGASTPALRRVLDDRRGTFGLVASVVLYAAIIYVMVAKPLA
jgi:uncharacterized membrane protein